MDPTGNSGDRFSRAVISPSLLKPEWSDLSKFSFNPAFSLGPLYNEYISKCLDRMPDPSVLLDDFEDEPIFSPSSEPPPKRSKLSLDRPRVSKPGCSSASTTVTKPLMEKTNTRFANPVSSPERAKGVIPANTEASTRWAIKNFNPWAFNCSATGDPADVVPSDLLKSHDAALVCKWLCRYVRECKPTLSAPIASTLAHTLSGSFSNCTINISMK